MNRFGRTSATLRPARPQSTVPSTWRRTLPMAAAGSCAAPVWAANAAPNDQAAALATLVFLLALAAVALVAGALIALRASRAQRRLAAELRDARAKAQAAAELLDVWSWQSDGLHNLVSLRPPRGAPASAWSAASLPMPLWQHFQVDDDTAWRAQLAGGARMDDIAVQGFGAVASCRGVLRACPYTDAQGRFAGYLGTMRELSSQPATAPAGTHEPLPVSTPPAANGDLNGDHESFSFTVSHDLRAPIRVVEGFTKIVKEDYGRLLDRVGNDHLDRVLGAAARMNNMIDALLALSKLSSQPLAQQPVNLSQLAGFVADDLRRQWPERAAHIEIEAGMQVQGDPTLLRVVVENLLGNAWKYTGKATETQITFGRHAQDRSAFTISDNGAGFDMRFADRLFGVFQRLHSANDFPGTGVGLASVRRIVRRHGGEIWGEGEVNRGARFHFSLPQQ